MTYGFIITQKVKVILSVSNKVKTLVYYVLVSITQKVKVILSKKVKVLFVLHRNCVSHTQTM